MQPVKLSLTSYAFKATDAYNNVPNTGVTRHYDFVVSEIDCAPDGYPNKCLVVNGQFPGPIIEANWGDMIEVKVTNSLETEGTALHWHGILQKKSPWMDGVPGVDQCPIAPGASFTYFFQVDLYGTTWYHSHYSGQFGSGLWGPLVVYGPQNLPYDEDLGPVAISDYYHAYYQTIEEQILAPPEEVRPPLANNNLINGKASSGGPGIASFYVQSGKSYRIRLINPSAVSVQKFSIDGYSFMIFANDLVPVEPYESNLVTIGVSQRTDIVFKATGKPTDAVWMRGYRPPPCGPSAGNEEVLAAIFYEDADTSKLPTTSANANAYDQSCMNDPLTDTVPYHPLAAPTPGKTENIVLNYQSNGSALVWYLNEQTFRIDLNDPILLETKLGNAADLPPIRNAHIYGNNISSVVVVIENPGFQPHPMHMHGHNIMILDTGECSYIPGPGGISPADQSQLPAAATSAQPPPATFVPNFSAFDQHSDGNGPAFHQSHQTESFSNQQLGQSNGHYGPETSPATTGNFAATTTNFNAGTGRSGYPGTEVFSSQGPAATESATSYIKQGKSSYAGSGKHGKRAVPPPDSCWDGTIVNPQVSSSLTRGSHTRSRAQY